MPVRAAYLFLAGTGGVFAWAGIKGKSPTGVIRALIGGDSPSSAPAASTIAAAGGVNPLGTASYGTTSENYLTIARYLVANGYSKEAAAGICGCIAGESGGNPESQGSGGFGLIGWTGTWGASPGYPSASPQTGNPAADLQTQAEGIVAYNSQFSQYLTALNAQPDPVSAADYYSENFERPKVKDSDVQASVATSVYASL